MSKQVLVMPAPPGTSGVYSVAGVTGALTATLAETDILFAFRWGDRNNFAVLDFLSVSVAVSGEVTTAVVTGLELVPVRDFFNAYTGGTSLLGGATGHEKKLKSNFQASLASDIRIANIIPLELPLVPGTEDSVPINNVIFGIGSGTVDVGTTVLASTPLFERATNSYPFVMTENEGFVVRMALNGPATGTFRVSVATTWLEISKQVF